MCTYNLLGECSFLYCSLNLDTFLGDNNPNTFIIAPSPRQYRDSFQQSRFRSSTPQKLVYLKHFQMPSIKIIFRAVSFPNIAVSSQTFHKESSPIIFSLFSHKAIVLSKWFDWSIVLWFEGCCHNGSFFYQYTLYNITGDLFWYYRRAFEWKNCTRYRFLVYCYSGIC